VTGQWKRWDLFELSSGNRWGLVMAGRAGDCVGLGLRSGVSLGGLGGMLY
jgi:hypothetical protein